MLQITLLNKTTTAVDKQGIVVALNKTVEDLKANLPDWFKNLSKPEVSIAVVNLKEMQKINNKFHGVDRPTDVLSFPYLDPSSRQDEGWVNEGDCVVGDLVVCDEVCKKQAEEKGVSFNEELNFLVDHGMRHLLGFHHE